MIEWIIVCCVGLGFIFLLSVMFTKIHNRRIIKKYNEEKDLSKQGEYRRQREFGTGFYAKGKPNLKRFDKLERRQLLQTTTFGELGEDKPRVKKHKRIHRILKRRRR